MRLDDATALAGSTMVSAETEGELAADDVEQKRITDEACEAVDACDLQAMGELIGAWELYLIARNGARPEKDRQDYTSWLKRMPGEHILTALEMKWIVEGEDSRAA